MNLDGKRSVNNIISSFCSNENEAISRHISSVGEPDNNSTYVVLDDSKHFTVSNALNYYLYILMYVNYYSLSSKVSSVFLFRITVNAIKIITF